MRKKLLMALQTRADGLPQADNFFGAALFYFFVIFIFYFFIYYYFLGLVSKRLLAVGFFCLYRKAPGGSSKIPFDNVQIGMQEVFEKVLKKRRLMRTGQSLCACILFFFLCIY